MQNCITGRLSLLRKKWLMRPELIPFSVVWSDCGEYFYSPLDGMLVHHRVGPSSPLPIHTPWWREALWGLSVLPKNTTQCPTPGACFSKAPETFRARKAIFCKSVSTNRGVYASETSCGGSVAEWFRALDLKSGGPRFKSSTLLLYGFVLGTPEFNSSTALCK